MLQGKHLFYTCQDNPDTILELSFELGSNPGQIITVPAMPVWFDWDIESKEKQFVVGLKFLADTKSPEIKTLSRFSNRFQALYEHARYQRQFSRIIQKFHS